MIKLILLMGFPYSGKSTFIKNNINNINYISIGEMCRLHNIELPNNSQIFNWIFEKIKQCNSSELIIDNPIKYLHQIDMLNYYNKFDNIIIWFNKSNYKHKIRLGRNDDTNLISKIRDFEIIHEKIIEKIPNLYYHIDDDNTVEYINNFIK